MQDQLEMYVYYYRVYRERAKTTYQRVHDLAQRRESYSALKVKYYQELEKANSCLEKAFEIVYYLEQNRRRTSTKTKLNMNFVKEQYKKDNPF